MHISAGRLEWASPESEQPVLVDTKFFVQRRHLVKPALRRESYDYWSDVPLSGNMDGILSEEAAHAYRARLLETEYYPKGTKLRVIKRVVSIETTICCGVEK